MATLTSNTFDLDVQTNAWDYVGVPYPTDPQPFGTSWPYDPCTFSRTAPAGWTSSPNDSIADFYYVDNTHGSATDAIQGGEATDIYGRRFGSPGIPRSSFPGSGANTMQVAAGAYVEIHGGPYGSGKAAGDRDKIWELNGTAANPVHINFNPLGTKAQVRTFPVWLTGSLHAIIDGPKFGPETDFQKHPCIQCKDGEWITIRNAELIDLPGTNSGGVTGISCGGGSPPRNIVFYNNSIINFAGNNDPADWTLADLDRHGMSASNTGVFDGTAATEGYNLWLIDNYFENVGGNGFQVVSQSFGVLTDPDLAPRNIHNMYIAGNVGRSCRQGTVALKCSSSSVISQNKSFNMLPWAGNANAPGFLTQYSGHNNFWILNEANDCRAGLRMSTNSYTVSGQNFQKQGLTVYFLGNLVYYPTITTAGIQSDGTGIALDRTNTNGGKLYVGFNTLDQVRHGITASQGIASNTVYSWNNIFNNLTSLDDTHNNYHNSNGGDVGQYESQNNFFSDPDRAFNYVDSGNYANLALAQAAGHETNSIDGTVAGNISFVNPVDDESLRDYDLQTGSPAIAQGSTLAPDGADVFADFTAVFPGLDMKKDFINRVRSAPYTIGAFGKDE